MARLGRHWAQLTTYSQALSRPWEQLPTPKTWETLPCCKFQKQTICLNGNHKWTTGITRIEISHDGNRYCGRCMNALSLK